MTRTAKEQYLHNVYIKWMQPDVEIPQYIIENFKKDLENLKR